MSHWRGAPFELTLRIGAATGAATVCRFDTAAVIGEDVIAAAESMLSGTSEAEIRGHARIVDRRSVEGGQPSERGGFVGFSEAAWMPYVDRSDGMCIRTPALGDRIREELDAPEGQFVFEGTLTGMNWHEDRGIGRVYKLIYLVESHRIDGKLQPEVGYERNAMASGVTHQRASAAAIDIDHTIIVDGPKGTEWLRAAVERSTFEGLKAGGVRKMPAYIDQLKHEAAAAQPKAAWDLSAEIAAFLPRCHACESPATRLANGRTTPPGPHGYSWTATVGGKGGKRHVSCPEFGGACAGTAPGPFHMREEWDCCDEHGMGPTEGVTYLDLPQAGAVRRLGAELREERHVWLCTFCGQTLPGPEVCSSCRRRDGVVRAVDRQSSETIAAVRAEADEAKRSLAALRDAAHEADVRCWGPGFASPENAAIVAARLRKLLGYPIPRVLSDLERERDAARAEVGRLTEELRGARKERDDLHAKLNTPELHDFVKAVVLEAAHQRARWGSEHDSGKTEADWLWLVGHLAGKALHAQVSAVAQRSHPGAENAEREYKDRALHHVITTAAALANWHAAIEGTHTKMRPGIAPPADEECAMRESAEELSIGRDPHINAAGQFQSDKYLWCLPDFVPLKLTDPMAQSELWAYAEKRRAVDSAFADDLQGRLRDLGYHGIGGGAERPYWVQNAGPRGSWLYAATGHLEPVEVEGDLDIAKAKARGRLLERVCVDAKEVSPAPPAEEVST